MNFAPRIGVKEDKGHHLGVMQGAYIPTEPYDPRVHPEYCNGDHKSGFASSMNLYLVDAIKHPSPLGSTIASAVLSEVTPQLVALLNEMGELLTMEHEQKCGGHKAEILCIEQGGGAKSLANGVLDQVDPSHRLAACLRAIGLCHIDAQAHMKAIYVLYIGALMPWCTAHRKKAGGSQPKGTTPGSVSSHRQNYSYTCRNIDLGLA